jgi:hypothetical protein
LIENSIKIIDNYLLSIKLVINNQEKSMKTRFYRRLLIDNQLKKLNTTTLNIIINSIVLYKKIFINMILNTPNLFEKYILLNLFANTI